MRLNPEAFHGDGCDLRLGHVLITGGSNVAQRFQRTTAPDGSVLLEADLAVTTTSPARGCGVTMRVTATDAYGLLSRVEGPGVGARTWSGLVSARPSAGGCSVSFQPGDPVSGFPYDSAFFWLTP